MRRPALPLLVLSLAAACAPKELPVTPEVGKAYFSQVGCVTCHRIGAEGGAVGPDLTTVGLRHSPQWLDLFIQDPQAWKPGTLMPNRRLSDAARKAIVAYLAEQKGQAWPRGERPWDRTADPVAKGRLIFARAGCLACHGLGGSGGYPNPNAKGGRVPALVRVSEGYLKPELVRKIKRGVAEPMKDDPAGPAPLVYMPEWGLILDDAELDAVASYLLTLTPATAEKADW